MRPRGYNLHLSGINLSLNLLLQYLLLLFLDFFFPSMFWVYIVQKPWQHSDSSLRAWCKAASNQSDHNGRWEIKVMSILQALGLLLQNWGAQAVHILATHKTRTRFSMWSPGVHEQETQTSDLKCPQSGLSGARLCNAPTLKRKPTCRKRIIGSLIFWT